MNCDGFAAGVIELARHPGSAEPDVTAAGEHLKECPECRARCERERELTAGLRALAVAIPAPGPDPDREAMLLAAFARGRLAGAASASGDEAVRGVGRAGVVHPVRWQWVAAAAVAMAVGAGWLLAPGRPSTTAPRLLPTGAAPPASVQASPGRLPVEAVSNADAGDARASARAPVGRPGRRDTVRAIAPARVQLSEFTPLPSAIGLPELESGRILRVEVPAAMLPAYGIEMMPEAVSAPVPLDMLVGQDGQPRAVRLAGRNE